MTHGIVLLWYQMFVRVGNHQWIILAVLYCAFINLVPHSIDFTLKTFLFKLNTLSLLHDAVPKKTFLAYFLVGVRLSHDFIVHLVAATITSVQ